MPVEIRKLVIKGMVYEQAPSNNGKSQIHSPHRKEREQEKINLIKFKKDILIECRDLIENAFQRKSKRY